MTNKWVLLFPDPEASFPSYMRKQAALRNHTAKQFARRLQPESREARLDFPRPKNSAPASTEDNDGMGTHPNARMGSADKVE